MFPKNGYKLVLAANAWSIAYHDYSVLAIHLWMNFWDTTGRRVSLCGFQIIQVCTANSVFLFKYSLFKLANLPRETLVLKKNFYKMVDHQYMTSENLSRIGFLNPWATAHYQAMAHSESGHGSGGQVHAKFHLRTQQAGKHAGTTPFVQVADSCVRHLHKWSCVCMHTHPPLMQNHPPASLQNQKGWRLLVQKGTSNLCWKCEQKVSGGCVKKLENFGFKYIHRFRRF